MIVTLEKLSQLNLEGRIVLCHGVFDVIHAGHISQFEQAKGLGDILVVSLTPDKFVRKGPGRPIFNQNLRVLVIDAIKWVDVVVINDQPDAIDVLSILQPEIYCKGQDATTECPSGYLEEEAEYVKEYEGEVKLLDIVEDVSSSRAINRLVDGYGFYTDILKGVDFDSIFEMLKPLKVLIVGETIIDEYVYCDALNRTGKELLVAARYRDEEQFLGGSSIVALNIAQFCDTVNLVTTQSEDSYPSNIYVEAIHPSVVKQRVVEGGTKRKLSEVEFIDDNFTDKEYRAIFQSIKKHLEDADLVICLDYGHGMLKNRKIVNCLCTADNLCLMAQANASSYGFNLITNWPHARIIICDEKELRLALHDQSSSTDSLVQKLQIRMGCTLVIVTLGHKGSIFYHHSGSKFEIPPFPVSVVDTMGAGDAFLSLACLLLTCDIPLDVVGAMSNIYGAMKVMILGNHPVDAAEYKKLLKSLKR